MAPEDFVRDILVSRMHARSLSSERTCSFGYKGRAMQTASRRGRRSTGMS